MRRGEEAAHDVLPAELSLSRAARALRVHGRLALAHAAVAPLAARQPGGGGRAQPPHIPAGIPRISHPRRPLLRHGAAYALQPRENATLDRKLYEVHRRKST